MDKTKRFISLLLAFTILIGLLPMDNIVQAATDYREEQHPLESEGHEKPETDFQIEIYRDGKLLTTVDAYDDNRPIYTRVSDIPVQIDETIFIGDCQPLGAPTKKNLA